MEGPQQPILIPLKHGLATLIDAADAPAVLAFHWYVSFTGTRKRPYATTQRFLSGRRETIRLHRFLLPPPDGLCVDHINGDPLDNRRCNLRICTNSQNQANRGATKRSTSGVKGVYLRTILKPWTARIRVDGRDIWLGDFETKEEAAAAYDAAANLHFGEFAFGFAATAKKAAEISWGDRA